MPEKPESFFEPGKPSHCIFSPDLDCDVYLPFSPFAPADFLCKVEPLTVGVILPEPEGDAGKIWDEIYERIAGVWQSRQVGFRCHRSSPKAWTEAKPCDACAMAREAQVVIVDLDGGSLRAESFRDMANASTTTLQVIKAMNPLGSIPGKLVILINCGPMNLPPHVRRAFHCIEYAGGDGAPDFDLLARRMEEIAHDAGLFQEGDLLSLDLSDLDGDKVQRPTAPAAAAAPEPSLEDLVKILSDTETSPPATAEQKSRDTLAEARNLVQKKSFAAALRELRGVGDLPPENRKAWRRLADTCLANLATREIVDIFYGAGRDKERSNLSSWTTEGALSSAVLRVDESLRRQIDAPQVPLYAFDQLDPEAVDAIYRALAAKATGPRTAITIARECEESAGRQLLEAGFSDPSLRLIEVRLADVEEQILTRGSVVDHLKERTRPIYRRESDPFLEGIHRIVCGDGAFFGRQELLGMLARHVRAGESFMVYGLPRAGKSSLLRQMMLLNREDGNLPVLVDLQSSPPRQLSELYHLVVRSVLQAVSGLDAELERSLNADLRRLRLFSLEATEPVSRFRGSFVDDLGQLASGLPKAGRLLLLFDELDLILPDRMVHSPGVEGCRDFLEQLRILAGQDRCVLGIGGFCAAFRQEVSEGDFPLDERIHVLPLEPLTDEECTTMIRSLGRRNYSYFRDDALAAIRRASGRDPLLAKYLSSAALEAAGAGLVDEAAARRGSELFLHSPNLSRRLERMFRRFSDYFQSEARLLRQLALEGAEGPIDLASFREGGQVLDPWLTSLSDYGLIAMSRTDQVMIRSGLLREWLRLEGPQ